MIIVYIAYYVMVLIFLISVPIVCQTNWTRIHYPCFYFCTKNMDSTDIVMVSTLGITIVLLWPLVICLLIFYFMSKGLILFTGKIAQRINNAK